MMIYPLHLLDQRGQPVASANLWSLDIHSEVLSQFLQYQHQAQVHLWLPPQTANSETVDFRYRGE